jgi:hypothetical protein
MTTSVPTSDDKVDNPMERKIHTLCDLTTRRLLCTEPPRSNDIPDTLQIHRKSTVNT